MQLTDLESALEKMEYSKLSAGEISQLLLPLFEPIDFEGKSLVIKIKTDNLPPDTLNRLYAYADWLRHLGAKNVVFLPETATVSTEEFAKDRFYTVRFKQMPSSEKVAEIVDWLRIAGADPEKVVVLGTDCELEVKGE